MSVLNLVCVTFVGWQVWTHDRQCGAYCHWLIAWKRCARASWEVPSSRHVWQVSALTCNCVVVFQGISAEYYQPEGSFVLGLSMKQPAVYAVSTFIEHLSMLQHCNLGCCPEYAWVIQIGACGHTLGTLLLRVHYFRSKFSLNYCFGDSKLQKLWCYFLKLCEVYSTFCSWLILVVINKKIKLKWRTELKPTI